MTLPVVYLTQAEDEVVKAYHSYETKRNGLGNRFLNAIQQKVNRIKANPKVYGIIHRDVRASPLNVFPYIIYYRDRGNYVLVVAIQHGRRSTRNWKRRV